MSDKPDYYEVEEKNGRIEVRGRKESDVFDLLQLLVWIGVGIVAIWKCKPARIAICCLLIIALVGGTISGIIEDAKPDVVSLGALSVVDSGWVYIKHSNNIGEGPARDSFGNEYTGTYFVLSSFDDTGELGGNFGKVEAYADLKTEGKYMYFEGTIFCSTQQKSDFKISFRIYADGKLVYDSGEMTTESKPKHFKIRINNADVIRIQSSSDDYDFYRGNPAIILVDAICYEEGYEKDE